MEGFKLVELPIISLVYPYYDNPKMFQHQQEEWNNWPAQLFPFFEVLVTDDCSPNFPAIDHVIEDRAFAFSLYRIKENVRWNWIAAKNLGAHHAQGKWLFLTDIDHRLPHHVFSSLLKFVLSKKIVVQLPSGATVSSRLTSNRYYTFDRVDAPGMTPYKAHPNTYFMSKELFWIQGGYDEEFSGYYGTDGYYRRRLNRICNGGFHLDGLSVVRYPGEVFSDSTTKEFRRKTEFDKSKKVKMREKFKSGEPMKALTFPWERLI